MFITIEENVMVIVYKIYIFNIKIILKKGFYNFIWITYVLKVKIMYMYI